MKSLILAAATFAIATFAYGSEPADRDDVEARLDALEKINVTSIKPVRVDNEAKDAELDAILQRASDAEATDDTQQSDAPLEGRRAPRERLRNCRTSIEQPTRRLRPLGAFGRHTPRGPVVRHRACATRRAIP